MKILILSNKKYQRIMKSLGGIYVIGEDALKHCALKHCDRSQKDCIEGTKCLINDTINIASDISGRKGVKMINRIIKYYKSLNPENKK